MLLLAPHIFLLSLKLYKVESVRHRAAYSRAMQGNLNSVKKPYLTNLQKPVVTKFRTHYCH